MTILVPTLATGYASLQSVLCILDFQVIKSQVIALIWIQSVRGLGLEKRKIG